MGITKQLICATFGIALASSASAAILFTDNFNTGASSLWGNEVGSWSASNGVYDSVFPSTYPNALSSLPFQLSDFTVEFDVNNVSDGGIWLRSAPAATGIGRTGVLLVTGGWGLTGSGLYWHVVTGGSYGAALNESAGLFTNGVSDPHLRVEVHGNVYSVFVDGSTKAATTLTDNTFNSGQVALYDFSRQSFDNVSVIASPVPEPSAVTLMGVGLLSLLVPLRRRRSNVS